jgi:hypothetical protein
MSYQEFPKHVKVDYDAHPNSKLPAVGKKAATPSVPTLWPRMSIAGPARKVPPHLGPTRMVTSSA